jgi:hypothetical protein
MAALLVMDTREAVMQDSGDVIVSRAPIYGEAGALVAGMKSSPAAETTVVKSDRIVPSDYPTWDMSRRLARRSMAGRELKPTAPPIARRPGEEDYVHQPHASPPR